MEDSLFLSSGRIHTDWDFFLTREVRLLLYRIEQDMASSTFTPSEDKVLRFLSFPLSSVRIIILGQDPYPQPGAATGRAFEVGTLKSWSQSFRNVSLKNILRSIYQAYTGQTLSFAHLRELFNREFPILPPNRLFEHWENQGVLLLNTAFTCETGSPGSHHQLWAAFTLQLLLYIQDHAPKATWFIWGNHARNATRDLDLPHKIETMHPMMCYDRPGREKDFLYGRVNCFEPFLGKIDWTGFQKIR
ncbi:MAG: uracil-DNA glycosylase [Mariniphaga sp.]|nr:uracil-DNA glycosylase [Mariniphaga sp.]